MSPAVVVDGLLCRPAGRAGRVVTAAALAALALLHGGMTAGTWAAEPAAVPSTATPVPTAEAGVPTTAGPTATTRVTYLSGPTIYVEAGRDDGINQGDTLEVVRDDKVVATLVVTYVSAHRAACTVGAGSSDIVVGDQVRYTARRTTQAAPAAAATATTTTDDAGGAAARARRGSGLHGRVGLRYLVVKDRSIADAGFSQRGIDLWLQDQGLGDFDLYADIRARRSYHARTGDEDEADSLSNVHRLAVAWHPGDERQTITFGRQFSPALSMMSLFDGVLYDFNGGAWSAGGFVGTEPEPVDLKVSSDVRDMGGYWQYRGGTADTRRWEVTTGAVASYEDGEPNREFIFLQGRYFGPRLTGFVVEEIDYYSGWKVEEAGESTFSLTSTYASFFYRAGDKVTLQGGYDNRRNVRLYLDQVTPASEFNDAHRQGGWAGAAFRFGQHVGCGADLRRSTGGDAGTADGYSAYLDIGGLTSANLGFRGRATHYANEENDGWLYEISAGVDAGSHVHFEAGLGHLEETSDREAALDRGADWIDLEVDVIIGRHLYLMLSGERYEGDESTDEDNDQYYTALSWRF